VKLFAGFWRDGAVVQPEARHFVDNYIIGIWKDSKQYDLFFHTIKKWHNIYWLDTTTPTELSPQEAFELCKLLHPTLTSIQRVGESGFGLNTYECGAQVNWGNTTEYPSKQKWRVPTDADKGKKCLFWDDGDKYGDKGQGVFLGVHYKGGFLVSREDEPIHVWSRCEVQDEA
jgi:hypothetical protein